MVGALLATPLAVGPSVDALQPASGGASSSSRRCPPGDDAAGRRDDRFPGRACSALQRQQRDLSLRGAKRRKQSLRTTQAARGDRFASLAMTSKGADAYGVRRRSSANCWSCAVSDVRTLAQKAMPFCAQCTML